MSYKEAEKKIAEAKRTRATRLSLNHLALAKLPESIGQLEHLKELYVHGNQLTALPESISQLQELLILKLYDNWLSTLPESIRSLQQLTFLDVDGNGLTELPAWIGDLEALERLDLGEGNGNKLTSLPPELRKLKKLEELRIGKNPGLNIPPEIAAKINSPQEILDYYFRVNPPIEIATRTTDAQVDTGQTTLATSRPLHEAKVLVVGEAEVGKTSIIKQLLGEAFDAHEDKTEGIKTHKWHVTAPIAGEEQTVRMNVWDFGGQEIMHATHQFFLTHRSLYVIVLDSRHNEQQSRIHYWLKLVASFAKDSPVVVVCNKCDQQAMELDWSELQQKYPQIKAFVKQVSCFHNAQTCEDHRQGIDELKTTIATEVGGLQHISTLFANPWFAVKEELEATDESYISFEAYRQICRDCGVDKESEQNMLVGFLNDLGIILHFDDHPLLQDTNVLNPLWVTEAVYRILNCHELFQSKGVLLFDELGALLKSIETDRLKYPSGRQLFIIEMMRRFELCFDFEGQANKQFLIPNLLQLEAPDTGDWSRGLGFQYRYEVLPASVLLRFIVRMHKRISQHTYWRKGVVLVSRDAQNKAIVKADYETNRIDIRINGPTAGRRQLLASIRDQFDAIHDTIKGLTPEEWVPLPNHDNLAVDHALLEEMNAAGETHVFVKSIGKVPVRDLLDGVNESEFHLFLSHNSKDKSVVREIRTKLLGLGVRCWFDEVDIGLGKKWQRELAEGLDICPCIAVVLGPSGSGPWHGAEMQLVQDDSVREKKLLIPVLLPGVNGFPSDLPAEFRFLKNLNHLDLGKGITDEGLDRLADAVLNR